MVKFQDKVDPWMQATFETNIILSKNERNQRFFEEATELVQACGATREICHQLVDYVFDRKIGERFQEVGGVAVTLAALCTAHHIDLEYAENCEIVRCWHNVEKIRAKQLIKPRF